ncbi:MAG: hypothetical protein GXP30_11325 [Verrucomicrobia bacterium]|nr:hypothetical protein [Verrucomicrobiota bacterium]
MPASPLTDFSDRFSPMLVKELRQGLRTNLFTSSFILLQVFMVFTVFIGAAAEGDTGAISGFFWFFLITTLLVAMPIRGFNALTSELQLNTMDLIQLTRLSAWRITLGKWTALMSQTALLVISILPYLVMRYFFGGVDLIHEFLILFLAFFASALLTAIAVGFSGYRSTLLRGFILVASGMFSFSLIMGYSVARAYGGSGMFGGGITTSGFWWTFLTFIIAGIYAIYFLLDLGASQIAPQAENHSTRKRLITLTFVAVILLMSFAGVEDELVLTLAGLAIALAWIDAITERPSLLPSVIQPFEKRRLFSITKYFLAPGWHTGILFLSASALVFLSLTFFTTNPALSWSLQTWAVIISWIGALTYPLIFIHLFIPNSKQMFGMYMLIQSCTLIVTVLISAASQSMSGLHDKLFWIFPIPAISIAALSSSTGKNAPMFFLLASTIFTLLSLAIPFWRSLPLYKSMRAGNKPLSEKDQFKVDRLLR